MWIVVVYLLSTLFLFFIEVFIWSDVTGDYPDSVEAALLWFAAAVQVFVVLVLAKFAGWL